MAMARAKLVDVTVTRWYHCVTRCVRQFLLGDGDHNRKEWLEPARGTRGHLCRGRHILGRLEETPHEPGPVGAAEWLNPIQRGRQTLREPRRD